MPGRFVAISLRDTGTGMAPEVLGRAFEPFFTTKEQGKGTGLGLSQVFGFARQSGGHVTIHSKPGQGTTVTLFLPQAEATPDYAAQTHPDGVVAVAAATVLLVEDDPDVREVTRATLRDAGLRVIAACDAAEALRLLEAGEAIDLLFTDVVMPGGMSGVELARRTRTLRPGMAILLASGYAAAALREHGVEPGEFAVLGKPYRLGELTDRIRAALDGNAARPGTARG
jgi:two-component system, NtrC family, sensor kinase